MKVLLTEDYKNKLKEKVRSETSEDVSNEFFIYFFYFYFFCYERSRQFCWGKVLFKRLLCLQGKQNFSNKAKQNNDKL